jgi:hypothetical protein
LSRFAGCDRTFAHELGSASQHPASFLPRFATPQLEAVIGSGQSAVEIRDVRQRKITQRVAGRRIYHVMNAPAANTNPLTVDVHFEFGISAFTSTC